LNALANHGFINHNGKDLTIPHLLKGLSAGLNIGPDFTTVIGALGLLSSPNPLGGAFDLNDLDQHNFPIVRSQREEIAQSNNSDDSSRRSTMAVYPERMPILAMTTHSTRRTLTSSSLTSMAFPPPP
jgi:hypothetical protein